jgi:membrane peptidoglycan carboxypeptidase
MKLIKNIIRFIILIVVIAIGILIYKGYTIYKQALENTSITDKVAEIQSKENYTKLEDMSDFYLDAVIAVEDRRFYKHGATDSVAIGRAIFVNIKSMELKEGGSTITQQLAKNIYFTQEKSALRKIAEIFMAYEIERNCNKDTVLELYLNTSYFGNGYYCVYDASKGYFGKEPKDINRNEASMLAGIPNAPSAYAPNKHLDLALQRQEQVLEKMIKYKFISEDDKKAILQEDNAVIKDK